jgi:phage FluMu gp28-like protein
LKSLSDAALTQDDLLNFLVSSAAVWAETLTELNGAPLRLEPYQIRFLNDRSIFRLMRKARQLGISSTLSIETTHSATTKTHYNAAVASVRQDEASEKLQLGLALWASIPDALVPLGLKPTLVRNAEDTLAFHEPPYTSAVVSRPASSSIRGGRKDIYFDEAAFIPKFEQLYQAGLPSISQGGRLTVVSTPMGESGLYYELASNEEAYSSFSRHVVPWWESRFMLRDEGMREEALEYAPKMSTSARIAAYGSDMLKEIRKGFGVDEPAFRTEYECEFVDETDAYYTWDLVVSGKNDTLPIRASWPAGYAAEGNLSIGVDLAKVHDKTVFTVVETTVVGDRKLSIVHYIEEHTEPYEQQWGMLKALAQTVRPSRISIDATGVGQMFVERAKREGFGIPVNVEAVSFTNKKKEEWATRFKGDLQTEQVKFHPHTELMRQIHGIKRKKTAESFYRFEGKNDDYFWSLMLAMYGEGRVPVRFYRL